MFGVTGPIHGRDTPEPPDSAPRRPAYAQRWIRRLCHPAGPADAPLGGPPCPRTCAHSYAARRCRAPAPVGIDARAEEIANELDIDLSVQGVASVARVCVQHPAKAPIKSQFGWDWPWRPRRSCSGCCPRGGPARTVAITGAAHLLDQRFNPAASSGRARREQDPDPGGPAILEVPIAGDEHRFVERTIRIAPLPAPEAAGARASILAAIPARTGRVI